MEKWFTERLDEIEQCLSLSAELFTVLLQVYSDLRAASTSLDSQ